MPKTNNELLKERIERNYTDFKSETLLLDERSIYDMSGRITAVEEAHYHMTKHDYLRESEAEYLLEYDNPLEMITDCLMGMRGDGTVEMDEVLYVLLNQEDHEENYITVELAEELRQKHGSGVSISIALLLETIEAAERYVRLLKLSKDEGADFCSDEE